MEITLRITKICRRCKKEKPATDFTKSKFTKDGLARYCKTCWREYYTDWSLRNGNRKKFYDKDWKSKNRHKLRPAQRRYQLKKKYDLTPEEADRMLEQQGYCCAICEKIPKRRLAIDHCHKSGKIRGLLCSFCNTGIGMFADDPARLRAAAEYIEKYQP